MKGGGCVYVGWSAYIGMCGRMHTGKMSCVAYKLRLAHKDERKSKAKVNAYFQRLNILIEVLKY